MLVLSQSTDSLLAAIAAPPPAVNPTYYAAYRDVSAVTYTPDRSVGEVVSGVFAEVVSPPMAGHQRVVDTISVRNRDSSNIVVSLVFDSGTEVSELFSCSLAVGESLHYENGQGFYALDAGGKRK